MFKKWVSVIHTACLALVIAVLMTLTGCHTAKGFGKDLKQLGDVIEKKADK